MKVEAILDENVTACARCIDGSALNKFGSGSNGKDDERKSLNRNLISSRDPEGGRSLDSPTETSVQLSTGEDTQRGL